MNPFGPPPLCTRCNTRVYQAEQVVGPGVKIYHKSCLSCMACRKRLDSFNLVEHNAEPYCKMCHVKLFGTRDLRSANLSPNETDPTTPLEVTPAQYDSVTGVLAAQSVSESDKLQSQETRSNDDKQPVITQPRRISLPLHSNHAVPSLNERVAPQYITPSSTGGRVVVGGPICPKCQKPVFLAEQKWHRACLRCAECSTTLSANRLTQKGTEPLCQSCYSKMYGPAGCGYGLR